MRGHGEHIQEELVESRQGRARCLARRLGCARRFAAGDGSDVCANRRGPQQPRGAAEASEGTAASRERSPSDSFWRCCALEPDVYWRAMGFPGCRRRRGSLTVKVGLPQRGGGRLAERASGLGGGSSRGSHTSLQAEQIVLKNPQAWVVWFCGFEISRSGWNNLESPW